MNNEEMPEVDGRLQPVQLSKDELNAVLERVKTNGVEYAAARVARVVANGPTRAGDVNREASVGNISDVVSKRLNPHIADLGLYVTCIKPFRPFRNRHNQTTGEMLWAFFREVDECENALQAEMDHLQAENEALKGETFQMRELLKMAHDIFLSATITDVDAFKWYQDWLTEYSNLLESSE